MGSKREYVYVFCIFYTHILILAALILQHPKTSISKELPIRNKEFILFTVLGWLPRTFNKFLFLGSILKSRNIKLEHSPCFWVHEIRGVNPQALDLTGALSAKARDPHSGFYPRSLWHNMAEDWGAVLDVFLGG